MVIEMRGEGRPATSMLIVDTYRKSLSLLIVLLVVVVVRVTLKATIFTKIKGNFFIVMY